MENAHFLVQWYTIFFLHIWKSKLFFFWDWQEQTVFFPGIWEANFFFRQVFRPPIGIKWPLPKFPDIGLWKREFERQMKFPSWVTNKMPILIDNCIAQFHWQMKWPNWEINKLPQFEWQMKCPVSEEINWMYNLKTHSHGKWMFRETNEMPKFKYQIFIFFGHIVIEARVTLITRN